MILNLRISSNKVTNASENLCLFDEQISYMGQMPSLPLPIINKIENLSQYNHSRDGLLKRFQILVFPYIDE
jgi:hypothetical protein